MNFPSLRLEGSILSADLLDAVAREDKHSQKPADFGLNPSSKVKDEIASTWASAKALWTGYQAKITNLKEGQTGVSETRNLFIIPLLALLGYQPEKADAETINGKSYAISHRDPSRDGFPVHIMGWNDSLEKKRNAGGPRISAHALVQEYLNLTEHLYGLITNGRQLRLLRDSSRLIKLSFLEFDLVRMFQEDLYADFALLFRLLHATRMPANRIHASGSVIEKYHQDSVDSGSRIRDGLAAAVAYSMQTVANGLLAHPDNASLVEQLQQDSVRVTELHQNLLRWVYRTLFVLVIEERVLHHEPKATLRQRQLYRDFYSLQRLRRLADRPQLADRRAHDLWRAMHQTLRLYEDGGKGLPLGIAPLGSFLFREEGLKALFQYQLDNRSFLQALNRLSTFTHPDTNVRMRVNYGALDVEEFGSVYESLLELRPRIIPEGEKLNFSYAQLAGNERKTTGSYYTPDSLVQCLLDSALDPVVDDRLKGKSGDEAEKAVLAIKVCDPAVGSGHFLIGAAHRIARRLAEIRAGEEALSPDVQRHALRDVISHCLYGVDINPLSVELCKVSLWMLAMEAGKPLSFLDHHIRCGNSLLGATPELIAKGIPDDAFTAIEGDDKKACTALKRLNTRERAGFGELFALEDRITFERLLQAAVAVEDLPDDSVRAVEQKSAAFEQLQHNYDLQKAADLANLWCAAFVIRKRMANELPSANGESADGRKTKTQTSTQSSEQTGLFGEVFAAPTSKEEKSGPASPASSLAEAVGITTGLLRDFAKGAAMPDGLTREVRQLAAQYQFFHWNLNFPEVFKRGGFDLTLGNPPWEKINLKDEEFFAETHPHIADAANKAERKKLIEELKISDPKAYARYDTEKQMHDRTSGFFRFSGYFPLTGVSRINLYSVFCETALRVVNPQGRLGLVLASGIVTDDNNKVLFSSLIKGQQIVHAWDFENREGIFPGVHRGYKFLLFCAGGKESKISQADFAFYLSRIEHLSEPDRHFTLTAEDLHLLNPNTETCPTFRNKQEAEITKGIYHRIPAWELHKKTRDWPGSPKTPFNMSNDSGLFVDKTRLAGIEKGKDDFLPLYESKFIFQFNHRFATFSENAEDGTSELSLADLQNPNVRIESRYWLARNILKSRFPGNWFFGYRMITNATNERAAVAAIIPERPCAHSFSIVEDLSATNALVLLGCVNSFAYDYAARQKIAGTNFSHWIWHQLPIPTAEQISANCPWRKTNSHKDWLLPRVLELTYTAWDLEVFAQDCGWSGPPFRWDEERRFQLRCELDAAFFHLYGLNRDDTAYILDTFPIVKRRDEEKFGTYRTKDRILELYDALAESQRTGKSFVSSLNPPPADPRCCHPPKQTSAASDMTDAGSRPTGRQIGLTPSTPARRGGTTNPTTRERIGSPDLEGAVVRFDFTFPSKPRPQIATTAELFTLLLPALVQEAGGQLDFEEFLEAMSFLANPPKSSAMLPPDAASQFAKWRTEYPSSLVDANALKAALHDHIVMRKTLGILSDGSNFVLFKGVQWVDMTLDWLVFDARLALAHAVKTQTVEPIWTRAVADRDLKAWVTA